MYHTCVCGICTYILYHCSIHMCVLATLCIIYICVCVCVNSWLRAPVIPMFVACKKKRLFWYIFWVCLKIKY